jgi:hypothetical protein
MSGFNFGTVGVVETAKPAGKKSDMPEIAVQGIYDLAAIDHVMTSLKGVREDMETEIKSAAKDRFIVAGCDTKKKPDNYRGFEKHGTEKPASATIELRKRSSASKLSDEEITLCKEWNIATEVVEVTVETFVINPEYLADRKVMGILEKLINDGVKSGKLPANIMLKQTGVKHTILAADALDTLFTKSKEIVTLGFNLCSSLAVGKTKFPGTIENALAVVGQIIPAFAAKKAAGKKTA